MVVAIIGVGLIDGSIAIALREQGLARWIIGVESSERHGAEARARRLVDELDALPRAVGRADLVILAPPVDACVALLPAVLDAVGSGVVLDVGSTKERILGAVRGHPRRGRFVATHPMWGTEWSGPGAAEAGAFGGKAVVLCDAAESDADALATVEQLYDTLGMHRLYMGAATHDVHVAYVSHISHITSFALANTVLAKEREDLAIFELASGGFESTVRLAKSSAATWVPIFGQNRANVLDALDEHIAQLTRFRACLDAGDHEGLWRLIEDANTIRRVLESPPGGLREGSGNTLRKGDGDDGGGGNERGRAGHRGDMEQAPVDRGGAV